MVPGNSGARRGIAGPNPAAQQAAVLLHRGRERLVRQRTGLVNALRGHLAEFGVIAPQGLRNVGKLIAIVRDEGDARLPDLARQVLQVLAAQVLFGPFLRRTGSVFRKKYVGQMA